MSSQTSFNPAKDIPDQSGRVFFVTGGTAGLGAESITLIAAKNPAHIFFSGRNAARGNNLVSKIKEDYPKVKISFIECDLTSLESVKQAANKFLTESDRLDVLMCNAGIMANPPGLSKDGYEIQFATNHLGHALLIKLLLPCLLKTAEQPNSDVRIINMSSVAHKTTPSNGIDFATLKTDQASLGSFYEPSKWVRYGQSKLANLLYPRALARQYASITSVSVHPGFIKTELHGNEGFIDRQIVRVISKGNWTPLKEGCYNQTWAATTPKENLVNGTYYVPVGVKEELDTVHAKDDKLAMKLWKWSEEEIARFC